MQHPIVSPASDIHSVIGHSPVTGVGTKRKLSSNGKGRRQDGEEEDDDDDEEDGRKRKRNRYVTPRS